jgi:hypothetical protein
MLSKQWTSEQKIAAAVIYPEDGASTFLRIVDEVTDYTASYPSRLLVMCRFVLLRC